MALQLFESMPQAELAPGVVCYNAAISACEKGRQWRLALHLFHRMPEENLLPTTVTYWGLVANMGICYIGIISPYYLLTTSKVSYNSAISAVEKGGQWQLALNLFHSMSAAKLLPDVISYNATISSCDSELLNGKQSTCSMSSLGSMKQKELSDFKW